MTPMMMPDDREAGADYLADDERGPIPIRPVDDTGHADRADQEELARDPALAVLAKVG